MDSLEFLIYTLKKIGMMILLILFATLVVLDIAPSLATFFVDSSPIYKYLTSVAGASFTGWLVMLIFLARLFYDDGQRHTAYEIWNSANITIVFILMLVVYFVPTVFKDSLHAEGKGKAFYELFYAPVAWLEVLFGMKLTSAAAVGLGIMLVILFAVYVIAYKLYVRKHKSLQKKG